MFGRMSRIITRKYGLIWRKSEFKCDCPTVERAQTSGNLPITLGQLLIYCRTATGGGDNDRARKLVEDIKRRYVANGFPVQETTGVSYLERGSALT